MRLSRGLNTSTGLCSTSPPPQVTHYAAVCLFLVFGARMLNESREASNAASDELEEVEAELSKKQATYTSVGTQDTQVRGFPHRLGGCTDQTQGLAGGEERAGGEAPHGLVPRGLGSVVARAWAEGERREGVRGSRRSAVASVAR